MAKMFQQIRVGNLTDDVVKAKTGKSWDEWCKILDKSGARMMDHREITLLVQKQTGLSKWYSQMMAIGYENERGMRLDEEGDPLGKKYEVTLTKLVPAPAAAVWVAWQDPATLAQWLPDVKFTVAKAMPEKILHLDWPDETHVSVRFYERKGHTRMVVCHSKLGDAGTDELRRYWSDALDRLRVIVRGESR